jgi:hypothetical protein
MRLNYTVVVSFVLCLVFSPVVSVAAEKDYSFDRTISQEVLLNYLSKSITMNGMSYSTCLEDDIRMIENIGAKFLGRVSYIWGSKTDFPAYYGKLIDEEELFKRAEETCKKIHEIDPEIIVQGCIFEIIDKAHVDSVEIPKRVLGEFGLKPVQRNFKYDDMLYDNGLHHNHWGSNQSVPDMSKLETQMWFFYRATRYIDIGYEDIHFGQCHLMDKTDSGHKNWWKTIKRIRKYAQKNARRHMVLCDSHTHGIVDENDNLMYDFHSFPQRPVEISDEPEKAKLVIGDRDAIYTKSKGGITPSGWKCDSLPYIVEFDNSHASGREGQAGLGGCWVWGYEEISWFSHRGWKYRNYWLKYASSWIEKNDPVGHLQMPGKTPMAFYYGGGRRMWYRANQSSQGCPSGYGQETTIKEIWSKY